MNSLKGFDSAAGNLEAVKALVEARADLSVSADGGVTPLHAAAELGALDLVNLLLKVVHFDLLPFVCLSLCDIFLLYSLHLLALCVAVCLSMSLPFACLSSRGLPFRVNPFACLSPQHVPLQIIA